MTFNLDEQFIKEAEKSLNIVEFPPSYRNMMMQENGSYFEVGEEGDDNYIGFYLYPIADHSDRKRMSRTCDHVVKITWLAREKYGLPENYIQIGDDEGAGVFLFKINPDRTVNETLWYKRHEENNDETQAICLFSDRKKL